MGSATEGTTVAIVLSPEVSVAMKLIGLEGEKLAIEMKRVMAVHLFARGLLSIGKAAELAEASLAEFMDILTSGGLPAVEYTADDLERDLKALEELE